MNLQHQQQQHHRTSNANQQQEAGPMKVQTSNNIAEQLLQIENNREEIQMGHCFKLPCIAILIAQITWKLWNSTH